MKKNNEWNLDKLHEVLLDMLIDVHCLCENNDICYSLAYGTALGAKRHNGFIPWDDDVDIYIKAEDYHRFKECILNEAPAGKYYLQEKGATGGRCPLPKLRKNNTTYIEDAYKLCDMHHGIYIDIFQLYNAPSNKIKCLLQYLCNSYIVLKELSNKNYSRKKLFIPILKLLKVFPKNFMVGKFLRIISNIGTEDGKMYFDPDQRQMSKAFLNKDIIFPAKKIDFEGTMLYAPAKIEKYLELCYGQYEEIPSKEQIERTQHATCWSATENFSLYVTTTENFEDEAYV